MWRLGSRCPVKRVDAAGCQIGHELLVFAGYETLDNVIDMVTFLILKNENGLNASRLRRGFLKHTMG